MPTSQRSRPRQSEGAARRYGSLKSGRAPATGLGFYVFAKILALYIASTCQRNLNLAASLRAQLTCIASFYRATLPGDDLLRLPRQHRIRAPLHHLIEFNVEQSQLEKMLWRVIQTRPF